MTRVRLFLFFMGRQKCFFSLAVFGTVSLDFPCQHCIGCSVLVWNLAFSRRSRCKCLLSAHQEPSCIFARTEAFCSWNKINETFLLPFVPCADDWMQLWSNLDSFSEMVMLDFKEFATWGKGFLVFPPVVSAHELSAFWETHAVEVKLLERIKKEK